MAKQPPLYTRGGDEGKTALATGTRVGKDDALVCAYGTVDELNAHVGLLHDSLQVHDEWAWREPLVSLQRIQHELFKLGTEIAALPRMRGKRQELVAADIERLEAEIDAFIAPLPPLRNFVLPRGHVLVSRVHICRTVCRRAERKLCVLLRGDYPLRPELIAYLNRLSDWCFALARHILHAFRVKEELWTLR